jgi:hypothetical protein
MQLTRKELLQEGVASQLEGTDPVAATVYDAYRSRARLRSGHRVAVVTPRDVAGMQRAHQEFFLDGDELRAFLLEVLVVNGERLGEVVFELAAEADYLLVPAEDGYRVLMPRREPSAAPATTTAFEYCAA